MRKIVSWLKHPARSWLRKISKAAQIMVQEAQLGWATSSLKAAADDVRTRTAKLRRLPGHDMCCARCARAKQPLTITVSDAAQMYEEIDGTDATDALTA